jgi:hypothetical protein
MRFLVDKAKACERYDTAVEFDKQWKHKEFELLGDYFKFTMI